MKQLSVLQWCEWKQKYWKLGRDMHERLGQAFLNDFPDFGPDSTLFYQPSARRAEQYILERHVDYQANQIKGDV